MISAFHHSDKATHADCAEIDTDRHGNTASFNMKILMFPNTHSPALHQKQFILCGHLQETAAAAFVFPNNSRKLFLFDVIWNG
jgi:hypothetical protein